MKLTSSTALLVLAGLTTDTIVYGRALPFADGLASLERSAVALARRNAAPFDGSVSSFAALFKRNPIPVISGGKTPPAHTGPGKGSGKGPTKSSGPGKTPKKPHGPSGPDGPDGPDGETTNCKRSPGSCGTTPKNYKRPDYIVENSNGGKVDLFKQGQLTRKGQAKEGVAAAAPSVEKIEKSYYDTKAKLQRPRDAAVPEGNDSPRSSVSDHETNLVVPFADPVFDGKLSDTVSWSRVYTHSKKAGKTKDGEYPPADAAIDAFYNTGEARAIIAEETYQIKDGNSPADRVPLSSVQVQKYKSLAGEGAAPPAHVVRRSVSDRISGEIRKARTALGMKNDGTRVTFEPDHLNDAMDDAFTMAMRTDNVRGIALAIEAIYPGKTVTKIHTWTGLGEETHDETVLIIETGDKPAANA